MKFFTKNLSLAGLCLATTLVANATPLRTIHSAPGLSQNDKNSFILSEGLTSHRAPAMDPITVNITVASSPGEQILGIGAVSYNNGKLESFMADADRYGYIMDVTPGTYDFYLYGFASNYEGIIFLTQENIEINPDNNSMSFNTADAVNRIDINLTGPSGEAFVLYGGSETPNCTAANNTDLIIYDNQVVFYSHNSFERNYFNYIKSNSTSGKFNYTTMAFRGSKEGMMCMVLPFDFSKSEMTTDPSNWQTHTETFAPTPLNIIFEEIKQMMGVPPEEGAFTCTQYAIEENGLNFGTVGSGVYGVGYDAGTVGIWEPDGYTGPMSFVCFPVGDVFTGTDSAVVSLPLKRGKNGLEQIGLNYAFAHLTAYSSDFFGFGPSNPFYTDVPYTKELGNCAPVLSVCPLDRRGFEYPTFNLVGRYGEIFNIDSWNMYDNVEPEGIEFFGGPTNNITVYFDGEFVTDFRNDYPYQIDWSRNGQYKIEFVTNNILVDGELNGHTTGTLIFDKPAYNATLPSVNALNFRKKSSGEITDHLYRDDAMICMYAADMISYIYDGSYLFFDKPESILVEYSPSNSGMWEEISMTEDPEKFFSPGFGAYYEGDLAGVTTPSDSGWYDLRISVLGSNGASLVQEISPAFNLSSDSGIGHMNVSNSSNNVEYYNLQGQRINNPSKGQLVIRKSGSKTEKIIF